MTTKSEDIDARIAKSRRWCEANPGLTWETEENSEKEPKIFLPRSLPDNLAFKSLSKWSHVVLIKFYSKRIMKPIRRNRKKFWLCENNGRIRFPYSEAESMGIGKREFRNAIDELQEKGFLDIAHRGNGGRKPEATNAGDATLFFIDYRWKEYGTEKFLPPRNPRGKDCRKGRGWAMFWGDKNPEEKLAFLRERRKRQVSKMIPSNPKTGIRNDNSCLEKQSCNSKEFNKLGL